MVSPLVDGTVVPTHSHDPKVSFLDGFSVCSAQALSPFVLFKSTALPTHSHQPKVSLLDDFSVCSAHRRAVKVSQFSLRNDGALRNIIVRKEVAFFGC